MKNSLTFKEYTKRNTNIMKLSKKISRKEIGLKYSLSVERVRQIILSNGFVAERNSGIEEYLKSVNQHRGRARTREMVRVRDNHTCQDCNKKWKNGERRFDIHHLDGLCGKKSRAYDRISDMEGLITLCHKCHFNRPEHKCKSPLFPETVSIGIRNRKKVINR